MKLKNKIALITGASGGMGKETALLLASEGAHLIINYLEDLHSTQQVVDQIKAMGRQAIAVKADVTNEADVQNLFQESIETFKTLDILVNNAGAVSPQGPLDITWDNFHKMFAINTFGPMLCSKYAAQIMLDQQKTGVIINISSVRGLEGCGNPGLLAYSAAKAALINVTQSLAKDRDLKRGPIRVNAIAPGHTNTDFSNWTEEEKNKKAQESVIGRLIEPKEIAQAVLYLSSDEAAAITGQTLVIDGGYHLK